MVRCPNCLTEAAKPDDRRNHAFLVINNQNGSENDREEQGEVYTCPQCGLDFVLVI